MPFLQPTFLYGDNSSSSSSSSPGNGQIVTQVPET
jgi:hypothetical protein